LIVCWYIYHTEGNPLGGSLYLLINKKVMKNLKSKVIKTLKWKKSNSFCAKKLNISLEEYKKIKAEILNDYKSNQNLEKEINQATSQYNLEKGEATLSAKFYNEPKTAEEIIKLLKIDTSKWKLSRFWNKQMGDHWRVSALISKINSTEGHYLEQLIKDWKPTKYKIDNVNTNQLQRGKESVCGVLSLQDVHFGKQGNDTIDKDYEETIKYLMAKSSDYYIENMFFVVGGDLINMDSFHGTTTSGTPVENSMTATQTFMRAFDCLHWAINYIKQFCNTLTIVYIPGNHDRLTSFHLAYALSKSIESDQIVWDVKYKERKVYVWGSNFNAFEHGDSTSKNTPLVYASEFSSLWGKSKYRTLFTGHFHQNKKVEYITRSENVGFVHKTLPSLSKSDYYHYHKKYVGNRRSGILELQSYSKGTICELTYSV
jgi:signal peptidase I